MTEEIKIVMEAMTNLGTEAKWAFMAWLAYKALCAFLITGVAITVIVLIVRTVRACDGNERAMRAITDALQLSWYKRDEAVRQVHALIEKSRGK